MQCEVKLIKATVLTYTKEEIKKIIYIGLGSGLIIGFTAYIMSHFFNYDFGLLLTYCIYVALSLVPVFLLIAYSQVFIACRNPVKLAEFKSAIKKAMQAKQGD